MKTIKQHEQQYWHIRKFKILPLLAIILFGLLAYGNYQLIDKQLIKDVFSYSKEECTNFVFNDLINIYPILIEYILISLFVISIVAFFKRGFNNIKNYDEKGLIWGLILGLIVGLIVGLIWGLIWGLILELILGLIGGLIVGLIWGLIWGLIGEFEK